VSIWLPPHLPPLPQPPGLPPLLPLHLAPLTTVLLLP